MSFDRSISIFYVFCGVVLLANLIRGWKAGPARMTVKFGAVAVAYVAAIIFGDILVAPLRTVLAYPDLLLLALSRAIVGSICYILIVGLGAVLFKKTNQQGVGLLRLLYGLSGAMLGLLLGVCIAWVMIVSVRVIGAIAQGRNADREKSQPGVQHETVPGIAETILHTSAELKKDLEDGSMGPIVKAADPLAARDYGVLAKTGRVLERPEAIRRFLEAPTVRQLARDPKVQAVVADPEIAKLAAQRDYLALFRQAKFVDLLNDPAVIQQFRALDLEAALNYALPENPAATPPPANP